MIKLSDVKVQAQYRTRVRYRLVRIGNIKATAPPCGGLQGVRESQRPLG